MKRSRDMDLIRSIMLEVEDGKTLYEPIPDDVLAILGSEREGPPVSQAEADRLQMHLELIEEAGLVTFDRFVDGSWSVERITGKGHDFLDSVRDPVIWTKTKEGAAAAGGFTLEFIGELAKGLVRQKIKQHTGVEI